ncbi:MAG: TonB family protein [Campylobacterales bacterium]|nr:TonB family protein [Campylobacterales bacterium]
MAKKQEQTKSVEKKIVSKSPLKLKEPPVKEIFNQQKQELTKSLDKPVEEEILERSDQDTVIEDIEKIADEEPETLPVSKASPIEEKKLTQPRKTAQELYIDENLAEITKLLQEHLYYPRSARKRGIEGEVLVKFFLSKSAEVKGIEVLSSQHSILSKGAIETIESLSGVFPMPKEALELTIPINYSLKR